MTRRDYIRIAAALAAARRAAPDCARWQAAISTAATRLAQALIAENPRFDSARFLTATREVAS